MLTCKKHFQVEISFWQPLSSSQHWWLPALQTAIKPPGPQEPWYKGRDETSWSTKQEILLFYFLRAHTKYSLTHILKIKQELMTKEKNFKSNSECPQRLQTALFQLPQSCTISVASTSTRQVKRHGSVRVHRMEHVCFLFFWCLRKGNHTKQAVLRMMQVRKVFWTWEFFHLQIKLYFAQYCLKQNYTAHQYHHWFYSYCAGRENKTVNFKCKRKKSTAHGFVTLKGQCLSRFFPSSPSS